MPTTQGCFGIPRRVYNPVVILSQSSGNNTQSNLTISVNADGNTYFEIGFIPDGVLGTQATNGALLGMTVAGASNNANVSMLLIRNGVNVQKHDMYGSTVGASAWEPGCGSIKFIDKPPQGTAVYTISFSGNTPSVISYCCMYAREWGIT